MKSKSREILNEKLKKCGELYSSTIIEGIIKINPDLDPNLIKLIKDLLVVGYTDGSGGSSRHDRKSNTFKKRYPN